MILLLFALCNKYFKDLIVFLFIKSCKEEVRVRNINKNKLNILIVCDEVYNFVIFINLIKIKCFNIRIFYCEIKTKVI